MHYVRFNLWSVGKSCLINLSLLFASSTIHIGEHWAAPIRIGLVWFGFAFMVEQFDQ